jgi:hypothetical protein
MKREKPETLDREYFDTFDWKLHHAGFVFFRHENGLYLADTEEQIAPLSFFWKKEEPIPCFWWNYPEGEFRSRLKDIIGLRALMDVALIHFRIQANRVLDAEQKTVLWINSQSLKISGQKGRLKRHLKIKAVRGYEKEFREVRDSLFKMNLSQEKRNVLEIVLEGAERTPGDYSSKIKIILNPEWSIHRSAVEIFKHLFNTMRWNEEGIK